MERKGLKMEAEYDLNKQDIHILYEFTYISIIWMHTFSLYLSIYLKISETVYMCIYIIRSHKAINAIHSNIFNIIQDI